MQSEITLDYYIKYEQQIKNKLQRMIQRCENKNNASYKYYGHRGINVCPEWRYDSKAFIYWCWENKYFLGCHIHRLNSNKNYCSDNCILCTPEDHYDYHSDIAKQKRKDSYDLEMKKLALIIGNRHNL